jgi:CHAD domain-containing protein
MKKKGKSVIGLYQEMIASFYKYLIRSQHMSEEDIHQLRVCIKNIRAFLYLLKVSDPDFLKAPFTKSLKSLFRKAGELRTIHINLNIIKQFDHTHTRPYIEYLQEKVVIKKEDLLNELKLFSTWQFVQLEKGLEITIACIKRKKLMHVCQKTINKKQNKIKYSLKSKRTEETLHDIRKHMKVIKTTLKIQSRLRPSKETELYLKELNKTEETIGVWHDYFVLIEDINAYAELSDGSPSTINPVRRELIKKTKKQEKSIYKKLNKYYRIKS